MGWIISHTSALEFWRKALAEDALAGKKLRASKLPTNPMAAKELYGENPWGLSKPLHVLVGGSNARKAAKSLVCHIDSREFPGGSFIKTSSGLIVDSPELCFAHMADELSLIELILLGYEFCGSYRLGSEAMTERGFRDDLPLTSVDKLNAYVAKLPRLKSRKNALQALQYIIDGSASPMETALSMLLTLPYRLGGYGFPKPLLNHPIDTQMGTKRHVGKSRHYCDLYWPDSRVDVEYDSDAYHSSREQVFKDATRRNTLSFAGVTVVTVSRKQVMAASELRKVAEVLGKLIGRRLQCPMPEFTERHARLRSQLLPKVRRREAKAGSFSIR